MKRALDNYTTFIYTSFTIIALIFMLCAVIFIYLVIKKNKKEKLEEESKMEEVKIKEEANRQEELRKFEEFKRNKHQIRTNVVNDDEITTKAKVDTLYLKYCAESFSEEPKEK